MAKYNQGDIVLIPFPYSDLTGNKQRPVVIISKNAVNTQQLIVAKVTSVIRNDRFTFPLDASSVDKKLKRKSEVRTNEVFTVHKTLIKKKFATMKQDALQKLLEDIKDHF